MSSAEAANLIREYLRSQGGTAAGGDVVAHVASHGLSASTVRRAADDVVTKTREGNRHWWALPAADTPAHADAPADAADTDEVSPHMLEQLRNPGFLRTHTGRAAR